jgi:hypothetical protein
MEYEIILHIDNTEFIYDQLQKLNEEIKDLLWYNTWYIKDEKVIKEINTTEQNFIKFVTNVFTWYNNKFPDLPMLPTKKEMKLMGINLMNREIVTMMFDLNTNLNAITEIAKLRGIKENE